MKAGLVNGKHYSECVELVKQLKRQGELDGTEALLLRLITAVEEEAAVEGWTVAPWYYKQLATIYREQKDEVKELDVLKRFASRTRQETHGLLDRLRSIEAKRRSG